MARKVLPFFRKQSTGMNRVIWILPGITEKSSQMESAQSFTLRGRSWNEINPADYLQTVQKREYSSITFWIQREI